MQKITPCLWFEHNNAEEAMKFYTSVFKNSRIISIERYPSGVTEGPLAGMDGKVLTGIFELEGQRFMCLDGGPVFTFDRAAVSFMIDCENQEEVYYCWSTLSAVPEAEQCGWLRDKYFEHAPSAAVRRSGEPERRCDRLFRLSPVVPAIFAVHSARAD